MKILESSHRCDIKKSLLYKTILNQNHYFLQYDYNIALISLKRSLIKQNFKYNKF